MHAKDYKINVCSFLIVCDFFKDDILTPTMSVYYISILAHTQ